MLIEKDSMATQTDDDIGMVSAATQTEDDEEDSEDSEDLNEVLKDSFLQISEEYQVDRLFELFDSHGHGQQCEMYSRFVFLMNDSLYQASVKYSNHSHTFNDLKEQKKKST